MSTLVYKYTQMYDNYIQVCTNVLQACLIPAALRYRYLHLYQRLEITYNCSQPFIQLSETRSGHDIQLQSALQSIHWDAAVSSDEVHVLAICDHLYETSGPFWEQEEGLTLESRRVLDLVL